MLRKKFLSTTVSRTLESPLHFHNNYIMKPSMMFLVMET